VGRTVAAALAVGVLGLVSVTLPLKPVHAGGTPKSTPPSQDAFVPDCALPFAPLAVTAQPVSLIHRQYACAEKRGSRHREPGGSPGKVLHFTAAALSMCGCG